MASGRFGLNDIVRFAELINRDFGIVVGRLQNYGLVGFDRRFRRLRASLVYQNKEKDQLLAGPFFGKYQNQISALIIFANKKNKNSMYKGRLLDS